MSFKYWIEKAVITTKLPNGVHDSNSFKVKASILNTNCIYIIMKRTRIRESISFVDAQAYVSF